MTKGPNEPLIGFLMRQGYSNPQLPMLLSPYNIHTVADVYNHQLGRWSPPLKHLIQSTSPTVPLPDLPPDLSPAGIRIGQLWYTQNAQNLLHGPEQMSSEIIFEIRGWLSQTTLAIQLWTASNIVQDSVKSARHLYLASPSHGTGSTHSIEFQDAFSTTDGPFLQFITGPDKHTRLQGQSVIRSEVIAVHTHQEVTPHTLLERPPPPLSTQLTEFLHTIPPAQYHAYLSYKVTSLQHSIDRAFLLPHSNNITAIIAFHLPPNPQVHDHNTILNINDLHLSSDALTEHNTGLLLLNHIYNLLGPHFPHSLILHCRHSSSTKAFLKTHSNNKLHTNPAQLLLQMSHILRLRHPHIQIQTHTALTNHSPLPERSHHAHFVKKSLIHITNANFTNDASNALQELSTSTKLWYLRRVDTGQPYLGSIMEAQHNLALRDYTATRDSYRRAAGSADRWSDNTLTFAGRSWRRTSPLTPQLNCRLLFDKHVHGGNVRKWKLKTPFSEYCPICQQPDSQTHWMETAPV